MILSAGQNVIPWVKPCPMNKSEKQKISILNSDRIIRMSFLFPGIYFGIFLSSLSGSLHCVGMCSGLMVNVVKNPRESTLYHFGRLLGYITLGALAGKLGGAIFSSDYLRSFQLVTSVLIAALFCWTAIRVWKNQALHFNIIPSAILLKIQQWSLNRKWVSPAFLIGLSSALLPCGWLHTFILAAVATQSPTQGALLLFFFWMGTVPALITSHVVMQKMTAPIARYSSKILAVILLVTGISTLAVKFYPLCGNMGQVEESCPFHKNK